MRTIILLLVLLVSSATYAQNTLTSAANSLRPDSVGKNVVNYILPSCSGENICWDFSGFDSEKVQDATMQLYDFPNRLVWDENGNLVTYANNADTLMITRVENPIYEMNYAKPIVTMTFPFSFGDRLSMPFSGRGSYEGKVDLAEIGLNTIIADATGTVILAEGYTLWNVLRIRTHRMADVTMTDHCTSEDLGTVRRESDIYEWYARGYRYPVVKSIEERVSQDGKQLSTVNYSQIISPLEMALLDDMENEEIRKSDSIAYVASHPLENITVTNNGSKAVVSYELLTDARVTITLSDAQGILYSHAEYEETAGESCEHEVSLSGLLRGQYVIYINVNGITYNSKVNVN